MVKRIIALVLVSTLALVWIVSACAQTTPPTDPKKHIPQDKYLNAKQAYEKWLSNPQGVTIIDVRTPEEYVYLGHAPMAINLPLETWTGKFDPEKKDVVLAQNPEFVAKLKELVKPNNPLLIMCRSGHRSAAAAKLLEKEGFTEVYNVVDGFEGDKVSDPESYFDGKRYKNGWKNSGVPWTYSLDSKLLPLMPLK